MLAGVLGLCLAVCQPIAVTVRDPVSAAAYESAFARASKPPQTTPAQRLSLSLRTFDDYPKAAPADLERLCGDDRDCTLVTERCQSETDCTVTAFKPGAGLARAVSIKAATTADMIRGRGEAQRLADFSPREGQVSGAASFDKAEMQAETLMARIINPTWLVAPSLEAARRYYPSRAMNSHTFGWAALDCSVSGDRLSACALAAEAPLEFGFGEAAQRLSSLYRVDATISSPPPAGVKVRLRVDFPPPPPRETNIVY